MLNKNHTNEIPESRIIPIKFVHTDTGNVLYIGIPDSLPGNADFVTDFKVSKIVHTYGSI